MVLIFWLIKIAQRWWIQWCGGGYSRGRDGGGYGGGGRRYDEDTEMVAAVVVAAVDTAVRARDHLRNRPRPQNTYLINYKLQNLVKY